MGGPLHRDAPVRRPAAAGLRRPLLLLIPAALIIGGGAVLLQQRVTAPTAAGPETAERPPAPPRSVAALGRLEPEGDIRNLAAPVSGFGGTPRIETLHVREGDRVGTGELLATFDNRANLLAERAVITTRLRSLSTELELQQRETARYRRLAEAGATSSDDLDQRELELVQIQGRLDQARAELRELDTDLKDTELRAPFAGTVLRLHARAGERPGSDGVLELGASDRMQAVIEVYETDIDRVAVGQPVRLTSESGGFEGELRGRVLRISPQVRQRQVLATDPTGDVDARIVEVRASLDPEDAARVSRLAGLKLIARFEPQ
ncbi:efflux RND transporter periplasmic adaptor subunit [Synechococcus sp. RSCCF101]|uniref:efflux RND transporter periplasmic adaptor subunit n=1 Tax=Synechococcus sp. RSCCF101 TaxID=2511069 RepID=UPI00124785DA|nr:efflux RND transporter periplasmic adaptor subunit [Synechococcus sp. RSCCF101]QEY31604.1 efflux RND transporter periplasmic adaptor subunit [Synechococcus sp. RSCCF101]